MRTQKPKDFKQFASAWAKKIYSATGNKGQTMKSSGCGPTAAADVIATLCDPTINPWMVAQLFMQKGFRTKNSGTKHAAFKWLAGQYKGNGVRKFAQGKANLKNLKAALEAGALVVCLMGPGYWTKGGHYIVAWKVEGGEVYCCDPGSSTRKKQAAGPFVKQCKKMFAYYP